jgi:O-antigen/teichoic acid export membrane protein
MNSTGKTIAKNAGMMMASQIITWSLSFLTMIFIPRVLGAEAIGQVQLAGSIWAIVGIVANFGMSLLLTKEVARDNAKAGELFGTIVVLRVLLTLLGFGAVALYAYWAGYNLQTVQVIYVTGISSVLVQMSDSCRAVLQGLERMEYISLAAIVAKVFLTTVSLTLLFMGYGILTMVAILVISELVSLIIQAFSLRRIQPFRFRFSWVTARWVLKNGSSYFLVSAFLVIYTQVDIVIISLLVNERAIGWYAASDTLFTSLMFIPSIFIASVFPALTRMHANASNSLRLLTRKSFDLLMLLSVPIGLGLLSIATPLVVLLFGPEFAPSGQILAVMGIVLIFTYQNTLLGNFLISADRQNAWTIVMAVATFLTVPLDLVFVPWCQSVYGNGAIGGALAFVVTELGMMITGLFLLPKGFLTWKNGWTTLRTLIAGLGMVGAVWFVKDSFIAIPVVVGAVTYAILILILRVVPREDWQLLGHLGQSLLDKIRGSRMKPASL